MSQISETGTVFHGKPATGSWRPSNCHRKTIQNIFPCSHITAGTVRQDFKEPLSEDVCKAVQWDESMGAVLLPWDCNWVVQLQFNRVDIARLQHIHRETIVQVSHDVGSTRAHIVRFYSTLPLHVWPLKSSGVAQTLQDPDACTRLAPYPHDVTFPQPQSCDACN
jgi:hypothetical protein